MTKREIYELGHNCLEQNYFDKHETTIHIWKFVVGGPNRYGFVSV